MSELSKNIKARRKELGITQMELALKVGYKSRSSINKIENGENDIPQNKIELFVNALNTTAAELLGLKEKQVEPDSFLYALSSQTQELTEENKAKLLEMARFFKQQQKKE